LTLDGRVKVTDFGVAKALGKLHMTIAGQVKGKLAYMSPEQLVGGGIDRRSDVFALGNVLYEITTGERPFQGVHDPQVMAAIIMGNAKPPSALVRDYPQALEQIVMRAMATDADARYATAFQLRQALEGWLASSGPPIGPRQIALLLYERCGHELQARAAGVMSIPPPPPAISTSRLESGSSAMEVDRRSAPSREPQAMSLLAGVLAVLLGVVLGLGVLSYVRAARRERFAALAATSAVADASVASVTKADASVIAEDVDTKSSPPPSESAAQVTLRVPEGAQLYVDGQPLPRGTVAIPRPDAGRTHVFVKAEGHQDTIVAVEPDSPDTLEVPMQPKKPRPPTPAPTVTTPPNPYE
jgi:serine/threonine-protein kinase